MLSHINSRIPLTHVHYHLLLPVASLTLALFLELLAMETTDLSSEEGEAHAVSTPLLPTYRFPSVSDILPFGRFHVRILIACGFGWLMDNLWFGALSFSRQSLSVEYGIDSTVSGVASSLLFAGLFFGATLWSGWSDKKGRRFSFTVTLGIAAFFALWIAVMPVFPLTLIGLFGLGFGAGGNLPVDGAVFTEFVPSKKRGFWMVVLSMFWPVGGVIATGIAWATIPNLPTWLGWRVVFGCLFVLASLFFVLRAFVPETPRFLMLVGRNDEAADVLKKCALINRTPIPQQVLDNLSDHLPPQPRHTAESKSLKQIFKGGYLRTTLCMWGVWFMINFAYGGFNFFLPAFLEQKGLSSSHVYRDAILYNIAGIPGSFISMFLVETRLGRKYTLVLSVLFGGAAIALFGVADTSALVITWSMLTNFFSQIAYAVIFTYTPELYPTSTRTTGSGAASAVGRIAGIIAPIVGGVFLNPTIPQIVPFIVYGALFAFCAIFAFLIKVETRGRVLTDAADDEPPPDKTDVENMDTYRDLTV